MAKIDVEVTGVEAAAGRIRRLGTRVNDGSILKAVIPVVKTNLERRAQSSPWAADRPSTLARRERAGGASTEPLHGVDDLGATGRVAGGMMSIATGDAATLTTNGRTWVKWRIPTSINGESAKYAFIVAQGERGSTHSMPPRPPMAFDTEAVAAIVATVVEEIVS